MFGVIVNSLIFFKKKKRKEKKRKDQPDRMELNTRKSAASILKITCSVF